jgi:hypothetical protein
MQLLAWTPGAFEFVIVAALIAVPAIFGLRMIRWAMRRKDT